MHFTHLKYDFHFHCKPLWMSLEIFIKIMTSKLEPSLTMACDFLVAQPSTVSKQFRRFYLTQKAWIDTWYNFQVFPRRPPPPADMKKSPPWQIEHGKFWTLVWLPELNRGSLLSTTLINLENHGQHLFFVLCNINIRKKFLSYGSKQVNSQTTRSVFTYFETEFPSLFMCGI